MAFKIIVACAFAIISISDAGNVCGPFQVFKECGSACEPICGKEPPTVCPAMCVEGCFCQDDYIRDANGGCISKSACSLMNDTPTCGENEVYKSCGNPCEPNCGSPEINFCTENCLPGCFCKPGYIKLDGKCVPRKMCDGLTGFKKCKENEEFSTCGSVCEATCENPLPDNECVEECVQGCFCKKGFVKNSEGRCIASNQC